MGTINASAERTTPNGGATAGGSGRAARLRCVAIAPCNVHDGRLGTLVRDPQAGSMLLRSHAKSRIRAPRRRLPVCPDRPDSVVMANTISFTHCESVSQASTACVGNLVDPNAAAEEERAKTPGPGPRGSAPYAMLRFGSSRPRRSP